MSRIFITMYNPMYNLARKKNDRHILPPFYETFLEGLKDAGNTVLCFHHETSGRNFNTEIPEELLKELLKFNPDICIFFNNNFYDITKYLDIPIVIYDVDSPNIYANKEALEKHPNRFKYIVNQYEGIELIESKLKADKQNIRYVYPFTEIRSDSSVSPNINVAFCGSHWIWQGCDFATKFTKGSPNETDRKTALDALKKFIEYPFVTTGEIYEKEGNNAIKKLVIDNPRLYSARYSGLRRARFLTAIYDLGLEIRGEYWDHPSLNYFPEIALCFNNQPTYSVAETQTFYNAAKIGFNTSHIQAISGFSWRVCDILASNACLVTENKSDLTKLFPEVKLATFKSEYEAREQCIMLLKNEEYRLEIVRRAQEAIDKRHRVKHAIENIEEFLNIPLRNGTQGSLDFITDTNVSNKNSIEVKNNNNVGILHRAERLIWRYLDSDLKKKKLI